MSGLRRADCYRSLPGAGTPGNNRNATTERSAPFSQPMPVKAANPRTQDQDATKGQHPGVTREDWQDGTPATLSIGPQWSPAMKTGKTTAIVVAALRRYLPQWSPAMKTGKTGHT